jgi:hypothetical protein
VYALGVDTRFSKRILYSFRRLHYRYLRERPHSGATYIHLLKFLLWAWCATAPRLEQHCLQTTTRPFTLVYCHSFYIAQNFPYTTRRTPHHTSFQTRRDPPPTHNMKSLNIFTMAALASCTLASSAQLNVHGLEDLVPRDIDPKTSRACCPHSTPLRLHRHRHRHRLRLRLQLRLQLLQLYLYRRLHRHHQ